MITTEETRTAFKMANNKNHQPELTYTSKQQLNKTSNGISSTVTLRAPKKSNVPAEKRDDDASVVSSSSKAKDSTEEVVVVVQSHSPPWKATFDYIADQAFYLAGAAYLSSIGLMARHYLSTQEDVTFWSELHDGVKLMLTHYYGFPFFGCLGFLILLRHVINEYAYPIVLNSIYEGKNHKYTAHFCEWLFDFIKNTILFSIGAYVAYGSHWYPAPKAGSWLWYAPVGGVIFDSEGNLVPTYAPALETIGHLEVTVDFVALLTLCYDAITEHYEKTKAAPKVRHGDEIKQATTTTSFSEDFVHHTGICFGALFLYITAKDNCNCVAVMVLLGQFNDMCEFAALTLGLCKNWFLERVFTPILVVFWTISLVYIWPAVLIPIFTEAIPIEHSFDQGLVLQVTLYQLGCMCIAALFWAMHVFWLYKGIMFLYRYQRGVYFSQKKLTFKKEKQNQQQNGEAALCHSRSACIASGTMLKPTREE